MPTKINTTQTGPQWFALTVLPGQEQRVGASLSKRISAVAEVVIPKEKVKKNNRLGQKIAFEKLIFPGYAFVKANIVNADGVLNLDVYEQVKSVQGIRDFVGTVSSNEDGRLLTITPMTETEITDIKDYMEANAEQGGRHAKSFAANDNIRVTGGSFMGIEGVISSVDNDKGVAKVLLQVFGRETAAEISTNDIEVVTD
jgi:transcriptional antiterminator NusG